MEIRYPKYDGYKKGNLDKSVKITANLKKEKAKEREEKEYKNQVEKLRSELWFPNINICEKEVKAKINKIRGIRVVEYFLQDYSYDKLLIYIHGGGFYGGLVETIENSCKYMVEKLNIKVVAIDYSLAPEFPFPSALNEIYEVLQDYESKYETIYLAGDSAGGNLATSCLIKDIELKTNIAKGLVLFYPVLLMQLNDNNREDFNWDIKDYDFDLESQDLGLMKSEASGLKYAMPFLKKLYVQSEEKSDNYYLSPMLAPDEILKKFPKTLIFTVEYDYLRQEAEYFFNRLKENKVDAKGIRYAGEIHAYMDKIGYNDNVIDSVNTIKEFFDILER